MKWLKRVGITYAICLAVFFAAALLQATAATGTAPVKAQTHYASNTPEYQYAQQIPGEEEMAGDYWQAEDSPTVSQNAPQAGVLPADVQPTLDGETATQASNTKPWYTMQQEELTMAPDIAVPPQTTAAATKPNKTPTQSTTKAQNNASAVANNNAASKPQLAALPSHNTTVLAKEEAAMLEQLNQDRATRGLPALKMDNTLRETARYKSKHMVAYQYYAHTAPTGESYTLWLDQLEYSGKVYGEIITLNYSGAQRGYTQWLESAPHANIMFSEICTKVGIGLVYDQASGGYYCTMHFGY